MAGKSRMRALYIGIAVLVALGLAGGLIAQNLPKEGVGVSSPRAIPVSGKVKGLPQAPVTIEEFADFQCSACKIFFRDILPPLTEFLSQGRVRLVFRHYPILGEESVKAALAAECAAEQGRFWEYHDLLFSSQRGVNQGAFSPERLKEMARRAGLQESTFARCLDEGKGAEAIARDFREGREKGVRATPTLFVNGRKLEGVPPWSTLKEIIEAELARAGR